MRCPSLIGIFISLGLSAQAPLVQEAPLRAHLALLADDLFEGRGSGQRGADLTVRYLETQLQVLGLKPAQGQSYRQAVRLSGTRAVEAQSSLRVLGGKSGCNRSPGSQQGVSKDCFPQRS